MHFHRPSGAVLVPLVVSLTGLIGAQPAAAKPPSCLRGDAQLVAVSGPVIVVRTPHRPADKNAPKDTDLLSCWKPTGKRGVIAREYHGGTGTFSDTPEITIVGGRYVGTLYGFGDGTTH